MNTEVKINNDKFLKDPEQRNQNKIFEKWLVAELLFSLKTKLQDYQPSS